MLSQRGITTVVVVTQHFGVAARAQADVLGAEDLPIIVLPHSFASLDPERVSQALDEAAQQVVNEWRQTLG